MELVDEWLPYIKLRNINEPFWKDSKYEREIMVEVSWKGTALQKTKR